MPQPLHEAGSPAAAPRPAAHTRDRCPRAAHPTALAPRVVGLGSPLLQVVGDCLGEVLALQATGEWSRVKTCARDTCRWVFVDHSRNRSGRWCSMQVCGNREKTAAYRARKR